MLSRLPPRSTPTATPARSRTKARSTGAGYRRCRWRRSIGRRRSDRSVEPQPATARLPSGRRTTGSGSGLLGRPPRAPRCGSGRLERLPSGEPRFLVVPEIDRFLAESPAQVDLPSLTAPGEVDQPLLDVAHHDVSVYEPGQFVRRGPGRGEPPGGPGVTPVVACGRGHRCAVSGDLRVGLSQPHEPLPHLVEELVGGLPRVERPGRLQNQPIVCGQDVDG